MKTKLKEIKLKKKKKNHRSEELTNQRKSCSGNLIITKHFDSIDHMYTDMHILESLHIK